MPVQSDAVPPYNDNPVIYDKRCYPINFMNRRRFNIGFNDPSKGGLSACLHLLPWLLLISERKKNDFPVMRLLRIFQGLDFPVKCGSFFFFVIERRKTFHYWSAPCNEILFSGAVNVLRQRNIQRKLGKIILYNIPARVIRSLNLSKCK